MQTLTPALINTALATVDQSPAPVVPVSPPLTQAESRIVQIAQSAPGNPRIKDLMAQQSIELSEMILRQASIRLGYRARDDEEYAEITRQLSIDIHKFSGLNRAEIMQAVDLWLDGTYTEAGKGIFFSTSEFVRAVKAYVEKSKAPVIKRHLQIEARKEKDAPALPPSMQEQKWELIQAVNLHITQIQQNPDFGIYGAAGLYDQLKAHGIYEMPAARANALYNEALRQLRHRIGERPLEYSEGVDLLNNCRQAAYNAFIFDLMQSGYCLDQDGIPTPTE